MSLRKDNQWLLEILLDFPAFQERCPSKFEAAEILKSCNDKCKAQRVNFDLCDYRGGLALACRRKFPGRVWPSGQRMVWLLVCKNIRGRFEVSFVHVWCVMSQTRILRRSWMLNAIASRSFGAGCGSCGTTLRAHPASSGCKT